VQCHLFSDTNFAFIQFLHNYSVLKLWSVRALFSTKVFQAKGYVVLLHSELAKPFYKIVAKWKRRQRQSCLPYLETGNGDFHTELVLQSYLGRFLWGSGQNEARFLLEMHLLLLSATERILPHGPNQSVWPPGQPAHSDTQLNLNSR